MIWLTAALTAILAVLAALVLVLRHLRRRYLIVTLQGSSMAPTYHDGEQLLIRRGPGHRLRSGHVAVVDLPAHLRPVPDQVAPAEVMRQRRVIKRVAALPGDPVPSVVEMPEPFVPPGCLVLLGDNPQGSGDSRQYGYVPVDAVVGIVLRPLSRPRRVRQNK